VSTVCCKGDERYQWEMRLLQHALANSQTDPISVARVHEWLRSAYLCTKLALAFSIILSPNQR